MLNFENEQTERIYNVTKTICQNISIPIDNVSDYVISQTIEQMNYIWRRRKISRTC